MGFRSRIIRPFANKIARDIQRWSAHAVQEQEKIFNRLIEVGKTTAFGKAHGFDQIHSYQDYNERVPIRDYEGIKPYIERIKAGEQMYCGEANRPILPKPRALPLVLNTSRFPKTAFPIILVQHATHCSIISLKPGMVPGWMAK